MDKFTFKTANGVDVNIEKLSRAFPEVITETMGEDGKIKRVVDFEKLKMILGDSAATDAQEFYEFTWPGKNEAIMEAAKATTKTLRPCVEESKNWDTTQNLYIEGDNLEALKILQEAYLGKVKMIYIDPPYNTGKDFVYRDNFHKSAEEGKADETVRDEETDNNLFQNTESNGRFHSDWCSMIYPRLKLARDLLRDDGVIFISIDDNEVHNLRKICDEIFGESNFVAKFDWRKKTGANDAKDIAVITETILLYAKNHSTTLELKMWRRDEDSINIDRYKFEDEFVHIRGRFYYDTLDRGGLQYSDSMNFGIEAPDGGIIYPNGRDSFVNDGWIWKWSKDKVKWGIENKFLEFVKSNKNKGSNYTIKYKVYQLVDNEGNFREKSGRAFMNLIIDPINQVGNSEMKAIFKNTTPFSNPKPIGLIQYLFNTIQSQNAIILDFFSGSATTAHACMQLNAEDGGNRKFIMVQLPEVCAPDSEAAKAGYKNICEIGKERIRRAGEKIKTEHATTAPNLDIGFRVLKLDESNMKDVFYKPDEISQDILSNAESNIKEDRNALDLLFACLIDWGVELSLPLKEENINGAKVYTVNDGESPDLIACFSENIPESAIREIAKRKPLRVVFRDSSFADSPSKINVTEIFKTISPNTTIKVL